MAAPVAPLAPHVPVRRNFAPRPLQTQTRLFGRAGPVATVTLHQDKGYYLGLFDGRPVWSHEPATLARLGGYHPDALRTVSIWPSEQEARRSLLEILSYTEWLGIAFAKIQCDVASAPVAEYPSADPTPIWGCSLEACYAATGYFKPLAPHLLQPNMIRR